MDWVLDRHSKLQGTRVATIVVRPVRVAYLVPDNDIWVTLRAVDAACLTWGGAANPMIPYSKAKGFSLTWLKILRKMDPDYLVDCVGIREEDERELRSRGQYIHRWQNPRETFFTSGATQYSAMNAFGNGVTYSETPQFYSLSSTWMPYTLIANQTVVQPMLQPESDVLYPCLVARRGRLDERFFYEFAKAQYGKPSIEIAYSMFANMEEVDFSGDTEGALLGPPPFNFAVGGSVSLQRLNLLSLTLLGLTQELEPYRFQPNPDPEDPQQKEVFANNVIVTGKDNSVSDLCLYWNLRMQKFVGRAFPLWIPLSILKTNQGIEVVQRARSWDKELPRRILGDDEHLYVISSSVSEKVLRGELAGILDNECLGSEGLDRFISGKCRYYHVREDREVSFANGTTRVPIPRPTALDKFFPLDRIVHEVSFAGLRIPQSRALQRAMWGTVSRIANSGVEVSSTVSHSSDLITLGIPDAWTVLESLFADAGYSCTPSDKGKTAVSLLNLIGGIEAVGVIASSRVHDMLREMCCVRGQGSEPREFYANRVTFDYSRFRKNLGESADAVVGWLVKKGVIFRGLKIRCPHCLLAKWYELDRVKSIWHCDGCKSEIPVPLKLVAANWQYNINELYARCHDQGVISHLLAMYALFPLARLRESSTLGYYPGILIESTSDEVVKRTRVERMELDIVLIKEGKLIVGECKDSGQKLTKKEFSRYVKLADHLECSRVFFITPTTFPQKDRLLMQAPKSRSVEIIFLEKYDILDVDLLDHIRSYPKATVHSDKAAAEYLAKIAAQLQEQVERP